MVLLGKDSHMERIEKLNNKFIIAMKLQYQETGSNYHAQFTTSKEWNIILFIHLFLPFHK